MLYIKDTIEKVTLGEIVRCKDYTPAVIINKETENNRENIKKQENKKENKNNRKISIDAISLKIEVPAETLFTDPILSKYKLKANDKNIRNGFVFLSSENLLSAKQKFELSPLVLKVWKINNLQSQFLKDQG